MISGLDHLVLLARNIDPAVRAYETLLGIRPAWRTEGSGVATAIFTLANASLEIMAPSGSGPTADRVTARLDADGEGLASLAFRVRDIDLYRQRLQRLGLQPEDIASSSSINAIDGAALNWRRTRTGVDAAHGVRLFFLEMTQQRPFSAPIGQQPITALDHVVIVSSDPHRAATLYGARLGLDMMQDETRPDESMRLMAFGCGELTVKIAHRLTDTVEADHDHLWGLVWRVADVEATHARLSRAGLDVTAIQPGHPPGTLAFEVESGTLGVKTQVIQPASS